MDKAPIVSRANNIVKKIKKLSDKKYRDEFGEYIAEGKRWINDAKRLCLQDIVAVICSDDCECDFADYVLQKKLFDEISDTNNNQGIMAIMRIPQTSAGLMGNHILFLDRIRDPGNMGAIIRTACAAGYHDIVLRDCVDVYNPKVIRSSMTGILNVRFNYSDVFSVKQSGYTLISSSLEGENVFKSRINSEKICLVIGNEAEGIAKEIDDMCDFRVKIPMDNAMESLNAAVSAGILMYELKYKNKENH